MQRRWIVAWRKGSEARTELVLSHGILEEIVRIFNMRLWRTALPVLYRECYASSLDGLLQKARADSSYGHDMEDMWR